ncbi:double zinc ribbon domain-containing protein [Yoonia sp. R2331]|uniref:double zinc ribbon domain-containing protein n=1 Tax=Yoonia sp. R2331 TaxID=3237238 RepID=UPI0034E55B26
MAMQSLIRAIYPPQCVGCEAAVESEHGLCADCWKETRFIQGTVCDSCGVPLLGDDTSEGVQCDDCMTIARPWVKGRSALLYRDKGRRLVLALKHGDRTDLAIPAARWMVRCAGDILEGDPVLVPVPLHWSRLLRRRYNQAALLSQQIGKIAGVTHCADALMRPVKTKSLDGHSRDARFAALENAITDNPRRAVLMKGRKVVVVDDVMTSGATLAAAAEAALRAGAGQVCVLTLARVTKDA